MANIYRIAGAPAAKPLGFPALVKLPRIAAGEGASPLLGFQTEGLILPLLSSPHVPRFGGAGALAANPSGCRGRGRAAQHPSPATERVLSLSADFRLICVSVVHGERVGAQAGAPGVHLEHLVRLRQWVAPLAVPAGRVSLHVMEALSATATLLEFARHNHVDLTVIGAQARSSRRSRGGARWPPA